MKDYFKLAIENFRHRKKRTFLTLLGIFIGVAAIVSLLSLGYGLKAAINEQFEMMGGDKILVTPKGSFFGMTSGRKKILTGKDLETVERILGVKRATGMIYKVGRVNFRGQIKYTRVIGIPPGEGNELLKSVQNLEVVKGRDLKPGERYKAIITHRIGDGDFFGEKVEVGDKIKIARQKFRVVGLLNEIGNPEDDSSIYIPLEVARDLFNEKEKIDMIVAQVQNEGEVEKIAESIKRKLRKERNLKEGEEDFQVQTYSQIRRIFQTVFIALTAVLIGIAAISLFVGGVGIMNTMYTSILERTKEIGVMKAVGARNRDISTIFLIESGLLGFFGGLIGIIIGVILSKSVELVASRMGITMVRSLFPFHLIIGALIMSFLVGSVSGFLPARKAARLNPVDALRYE